MSTKTLDLAAASKKETPSGRLSSVTSALLVLKVFSEAESELGISSIAKRLGLAKSTVHRLAVTLTAEGFVEQNPENGRYRLGLALFELGTLVRRRMDVSTLGLPLLGALRDRAQETVHLAILNRTSIVYLFNLESSQAIGIRSYLGMRKPAFCTGEGRVLLAFSGVETVNAVLAEGLVARTPKTNTDPKALLQTLEEVRQSGYAIDDEESEVGMRGVAAPIRDITGRVIAAVGLAGPIQRLTRRELRAFAPQVVTTADAVSARLGYKPR
ncbi:MAG: IclR family transcriptional regulator [Pseudomonadota bacterium]|nr:IclR family transcriptional regulator [Pseudomonadota bacterium]